MRFKGELPAFSENIIEINKKLSSLHSIKFSSDREISNLILKDMSLTNKLLKVVNSAFYGSMLGKVATISRAIFLLGFEKVRMAAASLIVFEYLQNKSEAEDLKDATLSSFFSAFIARDVARGIQLRSSEEAFICALLHNLGKLLVICYFPEEYEEIKNIIALQSMDEQRASRHVLGVSYSELGIGITRTWNFPEIITSSMEIVDQPQEKIAETETDMMKSIANYANELSVLVTEADENRRNESLVALNEKYNRGIPFPFERSAYLIADAVTEIDSYASMFKVNKEKSRFVRRLVTFCKETLPDDEKTASLLPDAPENSDHKSGTDSVTPSSAKDTQTALLKNSLVEIDDALQSGSNMSQLLYMILETMYRGFEFNRVLICMLNQSRTRMAARFGFGENIDDFISRFEFKIVRSSDFFNMAVLRRKDYLIDDLMARGIRENLPDWYLKMVSVKSILIYPLIVKDNCIGLFYADKKNAGILNEDQQGYMNILRNKAILSILTKH
jgi:HD-like signal output (HDOD) protein